MKIEITKQLVAKIGIGAFVIVLILQAVAVYRIHSSVAGKQNIMTPVGIVNDLAENELKACLWRDAAGRQLVGLCVGGRKAQAKKVQTLKEKVKDDNK